MVGTRNALLLAVLSLLGPVACRARKSTAPAPVAPSRDLEPFPARIATAAAIDFAAARRSPHGRRLAELSGADPADARVLDDLRARTGFDPLADIHRIVLGFPADARVRGEFGLVAVASHLDERRLVAYLREQAGARGTDLKMKPLGSRRLWTGSVMTDASGFFDGPDRVILGRGGWAEEMAERMSGGVDPRRPLDANRELGAFVDRVAVPGAVAWLASIVPPDLRRELARDERFVAASSVNRWGVAIAMEPGLRIELLAELSTAGDAATLARRIEEFLRTLRSDPRVLLLGAGPFLDSVKATPRGPDLRLSLVLADRQVSDLLDRLALAMRLARAGRHTPPDAGVRAVGDAGAPQHSP